MNNIRQEVEHIILDLDISLGMDGIVFGFIFNGMCDKLDIRMDNRFDIEDDNRCNISSLEISDIVLSDYRSNQIEGCDFIPGEICLTIYTGVYPFIYNNKSIINEKILSQYLIYLMDNIQEIINKSSQNSTKETSHIEYYISNNTKISYRVLITLGTYDYDIKKKETDHSKKLIDIILSDKLKSIFYEPDSEDDIMIDLIYIVEDEISLDDDYKTYIKNTLGIDPE